MHTLLAYLQLCRLAAVFTALADILLGYLLTHAELSPPRQVALLLAASAGLYLAGMVFNDVFDRGVDAAERPRRPLPSGRVSLRGAVTFGNVLLLAGIVAASAVGLPSTQIAGLLVAAIFLYDGFLKRTPLGPLGMGACRFLNVLLGASAAVSPVTGPPEAAAVWAMPQLFVAGALGTYITGVTWFARQEAGTSSRWQLGGALGVVNAGLALLLVFVLHWQVGGEADRSWNAALMLAAIGLIINRRATAALFDPAAGKVQASIRTMLLSLVMLDATLVYFVNDTREYAFVVALLLFPAIVLGRFLAVT